VLLILLTRLVVATGEEEEETMHQVRGKLFILQGSSWKEKGTGVLRLNVNREDGTGARLGLSFCRATLLCLSTFFFFFSVMRKDAVHTLLLNITLFPGMRFTLAQDPRYLRFTAIENGVATTYNLKVSFSSRFFSSGE
jgi:Ran-binding protein 3